ncbi:hypothetical protein EV214_12522 [Marinisporobacter balticus]|uniref:Resolvase/invertase-type recombinase catalytic domain-containing protein n=1 Tax=Marinisporobacter balticus TaxID=2018667 RepID=A0A4R2KE78_9FIRM|nr:hypothetical protein EV214_12522 [Marinisporobacter balticus]
MNLGYLRVSSQGQNLESQRTELSKHSIDKYFIDKATN